ncbi:GNAT family N-acetyltransferase [Paenibacillus polymyxa]|uniref:GNAT family N-acetyltransferase n=1 Tax=Paenibacillus polymyxa TaxID=1406 RepID=UPI00234A4E3E|nr:GNAT family N-acetyltransferase [Paenibacillus polymyxa]WCM62703.1 GNAT family N-acetyltransferase [Paenibacillus polymyxa]
MSMETFPILVTDRLRLRQLTVGDAEDVFGYFSKDEVTQYYDLESFTEVEQAEKFIRSMLTRYEKHEGFRWGITLKEAPGRIVGTIGFHNWHKEHSRIEIGYELAPEYWRQGLMTEAMKVVVDYGFRLPHVHRIEAFIDPDNEGSKRLLLKSGFTKEGHLRDYFYEKGQFVDAVIFGYLREEHPVDR